MDKPKQSPTTEYVTPAEFARRLNVSTKTVYGWIKEGRVRSVELPNRRYRIPAIEQLAILFFKEGEI